MWMSTEKWPHPQAAGPSGSRHYVLPQRDRRRLRHRHRGLRHHYLHGQDLRPQARLQGGQQPGGWRSTKVAHWRSSGGRGTQILKRNNLPNWSHNPRWWCFRCLRRLTLPVGLHFVTLDFMSPAIVSKNSWQLRNEISAAAWRHISRYFVPFLATFAGAKKLELANLCSSHTKFQLQLLTFARAENSTPSVVTSRLMVGRLGESGWRCKGGQPGHDGPFKVVLSWVW